MPRTRRERLWGAALAVTAGVTEEIVFRGLLIAAGVGILGLPAWTAALLSAAVFGLAHRYQGPAGMANAAFAGLLFTVLYGVSGNLLSAMALHVAVDLVAFVATPRDLADAPPPADPSPRADPPPPADPSSAGSSPGRAGGPQGPAPAVAPRLRAAAPE
jgi:hypothetical protein